VSSGVSVTPGPAEPETRYARAVGRSAISSVSVSSVKCAAAPSSQAIPPGSVPSPTSRWYSDRRPASES
jgi:hypothetical protein